jgi:hypothetical protein
MQPDARSRGMGGAYTAIAEGPTATWWNPGALGTMETLAFMPIAFGYLVPNLTNDIWLYSGGAAGNWNGLGFGLEFRKLSYGESQATDETGIVIRDFSSQETSVKIGAGVDVLRLLRGGEPAGPGALGPKWGVGVSLKRFRSELSPAIGELEEGTGTAWDMDFGTIGSYRFPLGVAPGDGRPSYWGVRAGVTFRNILDGRLQFTDNGAENPLGGGPRAGLAVEGAFLDWPPLGYAVSGAVSIEREWFREYDFDPFGSGPAQPESKPFRYSENVVDRFGAQASFLGIATGRVGYVEDKAADITDWTAGGGVGLEMDTESVRFGGQFDFALYPQPTGFDHVKTFELHGWILF